MTIDEHRGVKGHGVHCAATRKRVAAPRRNGKNTCYCPKCACVDYSRSFDVVAVRSEQAIVPFLHLRSIYALDPQSMEETSEKPTAKLQYTTIHLQYFSHVYSLVLSRMPRVLCCLLCSCVPLCTRCCVRTHCTVVYSAYTHV